MNVVEVRNVSKTYPSFCLNNVTFSLESKKITGFIGRNGAGKTTTIKAVSYTHLDVYKRQTIVCVISINVIAFALAVVLTRKIRGKNLFRTVFFMPNLIGGIVLGYTWQVMIDSFLLNFGQTLLANQKYGFWGLVILMNWQLIGYMMVIYIAGLQNVPQSLIEAAEIDGASKWQTLKSITIPMVMPSITICTFLTLTNSFKLYDQNPVSYTHLDVYKRQG